MGRKQQRRLGRFWELKHFELDERTKIVTASSSTADRVLNSTFGEKGLIESNNLHLRPSR